MKNRELAIASIDFILTEVEPNVRLILADAKEDATLESHEMNPVSGVPYSPSTRRDQLAVRLLLGAEQNFKEFCDRLKKSRNLLAKGQK